MHIFCLVHATHTGRRFAETPQTHDYCQDRRHEAESDTLSIGTPEQN
jgi:hypothetical protein